MYEFSNVVRFFLSSFFASTLILIVTGCTTNLDQKLSEEDFYSFEKIDAHIHVNTEKPDFLEQAIADNFKLITLNTNTPNNPPISEQQRLARYQISVFPNRIWYGTTFPLVGWENSNWHNQAIGYLNDSFGKGAITVKVWKNIGMAFKDENGELVMIDNPKFDPIFEFIAKKEIPVVGHLGEPKNCWLPLEEMTVNNDRDYFKNHPEYHMYLHPEFPSYEDQVNARDRMLEKHPNLKFVGAHLASVEWSIDELAKRFEKFPNLSVDFAHRMGHMQVLSMQDREKVRDFFIKYQDRLIYGSDLSADGAENPDSLKTLMHDTWLGHWKYFTTDKIMTAPEVNGEFLGLDLPRDVVAKIYHINAKKLFSLN